MESRLESWRRMKRTKHGVGWRYSLAIEHAQRDRFRMPTEFDAVTRDAADFFRLNTQGERGEAKARQKYPEFALAAAAWRQSTSRSAIQILVLADVAAAEICEMLHLQLSVLQIAEALYFDARPMLSAPF
jgi:hypothetical protein